MSSAGLLSRGLAAYASISEQRPANKSSKPRSVLRKRRKSLSAVHVVVEEKSASRPISCKVELQTTVSDLPIEFPPRHYHQRARSASEVLSRPRFDDNFLKPVPPRRPYIMSSVMGPGPAPKPHNPGYPPESYAIRNPSTRDFNNMRPNRSSATPRRPSYGQGQQQQPNRMPQGPPGGYYNRVEPPQRPSIHNRPRPSSSTSSSGSTVMSRDSSDPRMASPSSSRTSFTSFDSLDLSQRKPELGWQRPAPIKQNRSRRAPGELFAALPDEVLELIVDSLKKVHLQSRSDSCATCMMRDLCCVATASRRWLGPARAVLYEDIQLIGADSPMQKKRYKLHHGARLVLLRRTLRSKPQIAALVHSLKVPAVPADTPLDKYQNLVASVIMACPNFERLVGFHQEYDHSFNRLFNALSTREQLKDMTWVIEASPLQRRQPSSKSSSGSSGMLNQDNRKFLAAPGDLHPDQSAQFLEMHANWSQLTTLTIHCLPGATLTPVSLLGTMMAHLPELEDLHLSSLPPTAFNDSNLLSLPPLRTLSLSDMCGISDAGLAAFARRPSSQSIKSLTLRNIGLDSLPVLGRLFSHLTSLETFALVQANAPLLPDGEMIWLFPYIASASLRKLHWDITSSEASASRSNSILTRSITANGFPSLRVIRAPNDPDGLFQALCKPEERIELASDRYQSMNHQQQQLSRGGLISRAGTNPKSGSEAPQTPTTPKTPTRSPLGFMFGSSLSMASDAQQQQQQQQVITESPASLTPGQESASSPRCTNLAQARMAAQKRLEAAWATPRFVVQVIDENGSAAERFDLGGFLGETESRIRYCLTPDGEGASDESGGLVEVVDLLRTNEGDEVKDGDREGEGCCSGRWNARDIGDKRDRERWWHVERARWGRGDVRLS